MIDTLLGNDLVINEESCNLSCTYCLTGQSNLKPSHPEQRIFGRPIRDAYAKGTPLKRKLDALLDRYDERFNAPLLKITGGEVFLVAGIVDFIEACTRRYERVVVQTNGTLIKAKQLERMATFDGLVYQLSLDCHLHEGNSHRVANVAAHRKMLARAEALMDSGPPVEVYAVLHDRSSPHFADFARWLHARTNRVTLYPFPVRGPNTERFRVRPQQVAGIDALLEAYDELREVLPPRGYVKRLVEFIRNGGRRGPCHLPRLVASTFSDGVLTACPNIWFSRLGNVLEAEWPGVTERMGESGLYRALLAPHPRLEACTGCMTPWDILTLYVEGEVSWEDLCADPVYGAPGIRAYLAQIKSTLSGKPRDGAENEIADP